MGAPKGNQFWKQRSSHGRKPIFDTSDQIWEAACEYFQWVEDNPLYEEKAFHSNGVITTHKIPKMRAMTISGLCLFLDIGEQTWADYRVKPNKSNDPTKDFSGVTTRVEKYIYNQKFSGASADMLNANIIARDLGLSDKSKVDHTTKGDKINSSTIVLEKLDNETLEALMNAAEDNEGGSTK